MDPQLQSNDAQGTPAEAEVLEQAIRRILLTVHTAMPGLVVAWNAGDGTADIQPALMYKPINGPPQAYPVIPHVPVVFYGPAIGWLRFPVSVNDSVELHFQERAIDNWFASGAISDPADPRFFHLTDAVAVPGLRSAASKITPKGAASSMELAFGSAWLEITAGGQFKLKNGATDLTAILKDIVNTMNAASNGGGPVIWTGKPPAVILTEISSLLG